MIALNNSRWQKLQERRHLLSGLLLLGLLFGGHYLPESIVLLIMVSISWLAMISVAGLRTGIVISFAGFLIPFTIFALRDWHSFSGEKIGVIPSVEIALQLTVLCSMVYGAVIWVKSILKSQRAGFDEVIGACNLYIWIASIFACFYTLISKFNLHAFRLQGILTQQGGMEGIKRNFDELYYFSFVTQTTLGYGDIVPVSHFARALAVSQAMIGQFYVAVVLTYILNLWIRDLGRHVDHRIEPSENESQLKK